MKLLKIYLVGAVFSLIFPLQAFGSSCNFCSGNDALEKIICTDNTLINLYENSINEYQYADRFFKRKGVDNFKLIKNQAEWVSSVKDSCLDVACVKKAFQARATDISDIIISYRRLEVEKYIKNNILAIKSSRELPLPVKAEKEFFNNNVRPKNYFKVSASADDKICQKVLNVFNKRGRYKGGDIVEWLVSSDKIVKWQLLEDWNLTDSRGTNKYRNFKYAADFNGDNKKDYAFMAEVRDLVDKKIIGFFDVDVEQKNNRVESEFLKKYCSVYPKVCAVKASALDENPVTNFIDYTVFNEAPIDGKWASGTDEVYEYISHLYRTNVIKKRPPVATQKNIIDVEQISDMGFSGISDEAWTPNLIRVNNRVGMIFYPKDSYDFKILYVEITRDEKSSPKCLLSPKD